MAKTIAARAYEIQRDKMHERLALEQMPSDAAETVLLKLGRRQPYEPGKWWTLKASTVTADDVEWALFKTAAIKMLDEVDVMAELGRTQEAKDH